MLGLVLLPILAFPTILGLVIALLTVRLFKLGNQSWQRWAWVLALSALFTFGSRLPDFFLDAIDTHESVYAIHEPITLEREATVGLMGGEEKFRYRRTYFDVSGLKGSAANMRWGRPGLRNYTAFDILETSYDIQGLQSEGNSDDQSKLPTYPIVKVQLDQLGAHDLVEIEVWHRGKLTAQYAQRTRVWFSDEQWANANDGHTLLFLMKSTIWNAIAGLYETKPIKQPSQFLKEALVRSNTKPRVPVFQAEIEERWLTSAPSSLRNEAGKYFVLSRHCTHKDFPQDMRLVSFRLEATIEGRRIRRVLPEPNQTGFSKAETGMHPPGFNVAGISCGKDGYLMLLESRRWERIKKLYHQLFVLDNDFRPIGVINAELAEYLPTQNGRIMDFRQNGNVVTVTSLLDNKDEPKRIHQASYEHSLLTNEYATFATQSGTLEAQAAIEFQEAQRKQREIERNNAWRKKNANLRKSRKAQAAARSQKESISTPVPNRGVGSQIKARGEEKRIIRVLPRKLEDFPKAMDSWKGRYPVDIYLPARGFMALYFNTNDSRNVIYREETGRVAIDYSWDNFKGIPSQEFGALWYGRLETDEPKEFEVKVKQSHSKSRVIIDDRVVYETGRRVPKRFALPAGTHTILVEFTNKWHTTDFQVDLHEVE